MTRKAELQRVMTEDGWDLALWHHQGDGPTVFCCHGMGANRFDFDYPRRSFSAGLAAQGCDVWVVELRGAGRSRTPGFLGDWNWSFDHYVDYDLPAAVDYVVKRTGTKGMHWIGHSLGGILGYAYLPKAPEGLFKSCTAVGSSGRTATGLAR